MITTVQDFRNASEAFPWDIQAMKSEGIDTYITKDNDTYLNVCEEILGKSSNQDITYKRLYEWHGSSIGHKSPKQGPPDGKLGVRFNNPFGGGRKSRFSAGIPFPKPTKNTEQGLRFWNPLKELTKEQIKANPERECHAIVIRAVSAIQHQVYIDHKEQSKHFRDSITTQTDKT